MSYTYNQRHNQQQNSFNQPSHQSHISKWNVRPLGTSPSSKTCVTDLDVPSQHQEQRMKDDQLDGAMQSLMTVTTTRQTRAASSSSTFHPSLYSMSSRSSALSSSSIFDHREPLSTVEAVHLTSGQTNYLQLQALKSAENVIKSTVSQVAQTLERPQNPATRELERLLDSSVFNSDDEDVPNHTYNLDHSTS